jgi:hypothetical protein
MPTAIGLIQNVFIPLATFIGDHLTVIGLLAVAYGAYWTVQKGVLIWQGLQNVAFLAGTFISALYAGATVTQAITTTGAAAAQKGLNAALWANPIGIVIGLIVGLIAALMYAWNKFEGFRGVLTASWTTFKEFGNIVWDYMIAPLMSLGKTLVGVFTFDPAMIKAGIEDGVKALDKITKGPGISDRINNAVVTGYQSGKENDFRFDPLAWMTKQIGGENAVEKAFGELPDGGTGTGGGGNLDGSGGKLGDGIKGVAEGGAKNITINIQKLNDGGITIHTTNLQGGADEAQKILTKMLLEVSNAPNAMQ